MLRWNGAGSHGLRGEDTFQGVEVLLVIAGGEDSKGVTSGSFLKKGGDSITSPQVEPGSI